MLIYKIVYADDWLNAFRDGPYEGTAKDKEDGFIHFSTGEQLIETLKLHYPDDEYRRMLAISSVDTDMIGENLKWEQSRNGDLFPHLYGQLTPDAVRKTIVASYLSLAERDFSGIREFVDRTGMVAEDDGGHKPNP